MIASISNETFVTSTKFQYLKYSYILFIMPEGVKEFGSCKATTEIDRSSSNQILCLVIHPKSLVCDPSEFICQDRVPCLFCFCLLVCLIFIIIDR